MMIINGEWIEDGVYVDQEDFNELENGPFSISYETDEESGDE